MSTAVAAGHSATAVATPGYAEARYNTFGIISSQLNRTASTLDYINDKVFGAPKMYYEYLTAFTERLYFQPLQQDSMPNHGLAYIDHYVQFAESLTETLKSTLERMGGRDFEDCVKSELGGIERSIAAVAKFMSDYKGETEAERASPNYARDKGVIELVLAEIKQASQGRWIAEFTTISDRVTGRAREAESSSSERFSRIAVAVRSTRLRLGLFT